MMVGMLDTGTDPQTKVLEFPRKSILPYANRAIQLCRMGLGSASRSSSRSQMPTAGISSSTSL